MLDETVKQLFARVEKKCVSQWTAAPGMGKKGGASAEWLEAFAFANFDVAGVPVKLKAGQHTVYWGESLLLGGLVHGVAYSQNSVDLWKGLATPGTEGQGGLSPAGGG